MADELSPADRSSLAAERGPVHMAVGGVLIFAAGPGVQRAAVAARLAERLHQVPRLRQRLQEPPLGMANPIWVDDRNFDIDWHVRQAALPAPAGEAELARFVGHEMSRRLDRSRPLWEVQVVEGMKGGRTALIGRVHHALIDGMAGLALLALLLDPSPEPLPVDAPDEPWEPRGYDMRRHLRRLATAPLTRAQRLMLQGAARAFDPDPRRAAEDLRKTTELVAELARSRPQAPMTPLNEQISANRRWGLVRADLADLKRAGKGAGGTVNDAILAAVAGMLAEALPDPPARRPVALVPVNVRRPDEHGEMGNRISTVFVDLPTDVADPAERIRLIEAQTSELKDSPAVRAGALVVGLAGWAPPAVSGMLARAMGQVRAFNLVVSNLPGPQQPLFMSGARLLEAYPVVPLNPANQGLTVGVLSYDGGVHFGLLADRNLDPPVERMAEALRSALSALYSV